MTALARVAARWRWAWPGVRAPIAERDRPRRRVVERLRTELDAARAELDAALAAGRCGAGTGSAGGMACSPPAGAPPASTPPTSAPHPSALATHAHRRLPTRRLPTRRLPTRSRARRGCADSHARAAASALAHRAAGALVVAAGSRAVLDGHPAGRLVREAAFTLVAAGRAEIRADLLTRSAARVRQRAAQ